MDRIAKIEALKDSTAPVEKLVDARAAAALLGIEGDAPGDKAPGKRVSTWLAKLIAALRAGKTPTGILAALPDPAGYLNGGPVWKVSEIEKMRPVVEASAGSVGRPRKSPPAAPDA
ncbi:MAG TPA: hypothetical protein VF885_22195 [Arthrobacter sp.]